LSLETSQNIVVRQVKPKKFGSIESRLAQLNRSLVVVLRFFSESCGDFVASIVTSMKRSPSSDMDVEVGSILLLVKQSQQMRFLLSLLECSSFVVQIACSEEQAMTQATERPPFLVILAGDHRSWSQSLLDRLRTHTFTRPTTLIALTDFHAPSWVHQEENPGFDGFLVSPISREVLLSLVQSAYTRQTCFSFR